MIVLDSGDKIRGDAAAATVVDYTIYGLDNSVLKQLADGQLADSAGDLFTADSLDVVTTLVLVNTDSSARAVNLYMQPSGGTARRIIPKDMSLGAGYSLHWSGDKITVMNASGQTVITTSEGSTGVDTSGTPEANDIARFTDADTIEGLSYSELKAALDLEIGTDVLAQQTIGIADDNLVEVDGSPNSGEFGIFTANGLDGKTMAETKTLLGIDYQTLYIDAGAMVPCTTDGAEASTEEYGTNDIDMDVLAFDAGATEERAQFRIVMPENWDRSTIKAKFYWGNASGASASDTVEWGIKAGALGNDDAIDAALGTPQVISDTVIADGDLHITSATPALTIGGTPALGDLVVFEVYRNTDGTDDMAEDAWLLGCLIQFKVDQTVSAW